MSNNDEAPDAPAPPPTDTTKTPEEWRKIVLPTDVRGRQTTAWKHAAAAALHGWNEHAYHAGSEMRLERADYEAALDAASSIPQGAKTYVPHPAALSSHSANAPKKG